MKSFFHVLLFLLLSANFIVTYAQPISPFERCKVFHTENTQKFESWLQTNKTSFASQTDKIYRIPVVVHVIHKGEPVGEGDNISDEQVFSQIRVLNEDFRRKEGTKGHNTHSAGGDAKIEFVLAKSSPLGEETDGIVRVDRTKVDPPNFSGNLPALGAYFSFWDPNLYLNIWAFPGVVDTGLGEARFPISNLPGLEKEKERDFEIPGIDSLHGIPVSEIDGIAINTLHFGEVNIDSKYNLGRTGTHEMGHFLGLFHIWGDKGFEVSCDTDDYCDDTPNVASRTSGCPTTKLACDGSLAMIENYMDYTDDACMNIFTNDQIARMRTVLENSPRRKSLLTSPGLNPPDVPTGIGDDFSNHIAIYPNPATDRIYIELDEVSRKDSFYIKCYNLLGELFYSEYYDNFIGNRFEVKLPESTEQIILLKVEMGKYAFSKKIICR
ncbi:MAG: M43 family zinc metalloprotease [Bacteroidota bacterium]